MKRATDLIGKSLYQEGRMLTHSGILFNLLDPDPDDILIEDIAVHLSRIARWNGGTHQFYSVAEHCCRCCDAADPDDKLMMLLHDAEEAYFGDIISTVKSILKKVAPEITDKMKALRVMIFEKFGVKTDEVSIAVMNTLDRSELQRDFDELIIGRNRDCWSPQIACREFLKRFDEIAGLPDKGIPSVWDRVEYAGFDCAIVRAPDKYDTYISCLPYKITIKPMSSQIDIGNGQGISLVVNSEDPLLKISR